MIQFRCLDCGRRVVSYDGEPGTAHCASCAWITAHVPPEHQTDARERLGVPLAREGSGACRVNEMVGAVLPVEVIELCRRALSRES